MPQDDLKICFNTYTYTIYKRMVKYSILRRTCHPPTIALSHLVCGGGGGGDVVEDAV